VPALALGGVALTLIFRMWIGGAWPTFLPYTLAGVMSLIVCAQIFWYLIRRKNY